METIQTDRAFHRVKSLVETRYNKVAPAEGAELSGLGFSDTQRGHLFVEVEGSFKRTIKVLF